MKKTKADLTGQRFGKLLVLREVEKIGRARAYECQCDCGTIKQIRIGNLLSGSTNSCGCLYRKDITGQKFGYLTVLEYDKTSEVGKTKWICKCDCGNNKAVSTDCLKYGYTSSCGCQTWVNDGLSIRDLIGVRFGKLVVVGQEKSDKDRRWRCKCDCGKERIVKTSYLTNGQVQQCIECNRDRTSLIGERFGTLRVVAFDGVYNQISYWLCECDCGHKNCKKTISTTTRCLKDLPNRRCTSGRSKEDNYNWSGYEQISGAYWCHLKHSAKTRNLEFSITKEQIWDRFLEQDWICALSGQELFWGDEKETTASLDRIDSYKGYNIDNVWWVHKKVNIMKVRLSVEELIYWCNLVVNNDTSEYKFIYDSENIKSHGWKGYGLISGTYMDTVKRGAKSRNLNISISIQDMWQKFLEQNGRCSLTNIPLIFAEKFSDRKTQTASLDRINSEIGYELDNIRWVHKTINNIKWASSDNEFIELCTKIVNHNKDKYEFAT